MPKADIAVMLEGPKSKGKGDQEALPKPAKGAADDDTLEHNLWMQAADALKQGDTSAFADSALQATEECVKRVRAGEY